MNKYYLLAFFLMAFLFGSCDIIIPEIGKEKYVLEVDTDTLKFRSTEQRISFLIKSNGAWHIQVNPQSQTTFCSFSPESGEGDAWVMVAAELNNTYYHRTEDILIQGEEDAKKLTITQTAPLPKLADRVCRIRGLDGGGLLSTLPADGGIVEIVGFHFGQADFRCDCENVYVDTLSRKPDYHNYKAVVPASPTAEGRTIGFFLTLTTESGELTEPYYIKQD